MANRDTPNTYFAWYNDDDRLAIVVRQSDSNTSKGITSGEYDTFYDSGNLSGTITTFADNGDGTVRVTDPGHGLATGDTISITSSPDNDYATASADSGGDYTVTKVNTSLFDITATYVAEASGSWTSLFVDEGIRMTVHSKYETVTAITDDLQDTCGLDSIMHSNILDYVKSRVLEDMGQIEPSLYFRKKFEIGVARKPTRRSGVRFLAVPKL